jgi:O-antigen ligase
MIYFFIIKLKNKYVYYGLLLASFGALVLTYSRGAILMLLFSVFTYSLLKKNYKLIGGLIGVLIIVTIALSPNFHTVNTDLFRMPSLTARIENIKQTLYVYRKNPVFGVGFNNYRYARERYIQKDWVDYPSHAGAGSDNSFALILATAGIPGFITYLYLFYRIFRLGLGNIRKTPFALVLVVSLTGLIVNGFLINSLFYSFIMIWMWMIVGLSESNSRG